MATAEQVRVVLNDGVLTLGTLGPVCIYLYRDLMSLAHITRGRSLHKSQFKRHPEGLSVLIVYRTPRYLGSEMSELRAEFIALMREADELVKHVGVVIEETGFLGATIRASASGLSLLARPKFGIRYLATTDEATAWLCAQSSRADAVSVPALRAAVAHMEALPLGVLSG